MKQIVFPIALGLIILLGAGCEAPVQYGRVEPNLGYPVLYTNAELPEYPNARVTNRGPQENLLEAGIKLNIRSTDDPETIATYYREQLLAGGWEEPIEALVGEGLHHAEFEKEDLHYTLVITDQGESTLISIIFEQTKNQ